MAKQVRVAIVDSGIDFHHSNLMKYVCKDSRGKPLGYNALDKNPFPVDTIGHGTHVAGIIINQIETISPREICIIPIKMYDNKSTPKNMDFWKNTKEAFMYAINHKADIVNFSVAGIGKSSVEQEVIRVLRRKGILLIAAAGNAGEDLAEICNYYPACYNHKKEQFNNLLVVGNLSHSNMCSQSSNYNGPVDVYDYGTKIRSTYLAGNYSVLSGTSMSTARLSGLAAFYKVRKKLTSYRELKNYLIKISINNCRRPVVKRRGRRRGVY